MRILMLNPTWNTHRILHQNPTGEHTFRPVPATDFSAESMRIQHQNLVAFCTEVSMENIPFYLMGIPAIVFRSLAKPLHKR